MSHIKNVILFLLAPFIGLAYLFALPFVGFWMVLRLSVKRVVR